MKEARLEVALSLSIAALAALHVALAHQQSDSAAASCEYAMAPLLLQALHIIHRLVSFKLSKNSYTFFDALTRTNDIGIFSNNLELEILWPL